MRTLEGKRDTTKQGEDSPEIPLRAPFPGSWKGYWKLTAGIVVIVTAWIGFQHITVVGLGDKHQLNSIESLYQAISLFFLYPRVVPDKGTDRWITVMWLLYFLAPALTTTVILDLLSKLKTALRNPERAVKLMKNHTIVCGLGKHGRLILKCIIEANPYSDVVIVDRDLSLPQFFELVPGAAIPVIHGNISDPETLRRAGVERARKLLALSGGDVVNINTCLSALQLSKIPCFQAVALVSDVALSAAISKLSRQEGVVTLNPYEIAASNLVSQLNLEEGRASELGSNLIVGGFGRFGQMFVKAVLENHKGTSAAHIRVIDRIATRKVEHFKHTYHFENNYILPIDGEVEDLRLLQLACQDSTSESPGAEPTIILCIDDDTTILNTALMIKEHWGIKATVITRLFEPPPKFQQLASGAHIRVFVLSELIAKELPKECY